MEGRGSSAQTQKVESPAAMPTRSTSARFLLDLEQVERNIDSDVMQSATKKILFPCKTSTAVIHSRMNVSQYLEACSQNVSAEIWSLFENTFKNTFPGWRDRRLPVMRMIRDANSVLDLLDKDGLQLDLDEYLNNIFLVNDSWSLLRRNSEGYFLQDGIKLSTYDNDLQYPNTVHLIGYFKPYIMDLYWIYMIQGNSVPSGMIKSMINSSNRQSFQYAGRVDTGLVPINSEQLAAIQQMKTNVEGIQGPPGTGKSTTIYHIVKGCVPQDMNCLVVCVQNKALESIVDKLSIDDGLKFVVVGNDSRLNTNCKKYTIFGLIESSEKYLSCLKELRRLDKISSLLHQTYQQKKDICKATSKWSSAWDLYINSKYCHLRHEDQMYHAKVLWQRKHLKETCNEVYQEILSTRNIFVSTVDSVQNIRQGKRCVLVIDEAGVVPEFKMPALIVSHTIESVIAIGDQKQLTPFSYTGNGNSFFHRLAKTLTFPMLKTQYRMHRNICDVVSKAFYNNELVTWSNIVRKDGRVEWCDHIQGEDGKSSKYNQREIDVLTSTMSKQDLRNYIESNSVMIITFYKEQFTRLWMLRR